MPTFPTGLSMLFPVAASADDFAAVPSVLTLAETPSVALAFPGKLIAPSSDVGSFALCKAPVSGRTPPCPPASPLFKSALLAVPGNTMPPVMPLAGSVAETFVVEGNGV